MGTDITVIANNKEIRTEFRKYYYQYILLFGGSFAIYLPDQGDVTWEFTEKIWNYNLDLNDIKVTASHAA